MSGNGLIPSSEEMTGRGDSKNHRAPSRWRKIGILALALVPLGTAIVWRRFTPKARFTPVFEASRAVTCDVACVRARTVHVELRDGRSCGGVRLGHLDARYVLTAAHCARRAPVSVEFVGGVRASVRSVHEMAPGEPLAPGSPHDAAILVVDSAPGLEVFVDAEAHLPALLALPQRDAGSLAVELVPIAISVANSVRYTITGPRERLCHGTSGSPVWTRSGRGYNLSGIVSSGAHRLAPCGG